jgi:hypothetical protein
MKNPDWSVNQDYQVQPCTRALSISRESVDRLEHRIDRSIYFQAMNLSASLEPILRSPRGAFEKFDLDSPLASGECNEVPWHESLLNPAARVDSIDPLPNAKWRIDGSGGQGLQFFAVPVFLFPDLVPCRIDVFIPDQRNHPPTLRKVLQSDAAFHLLDDRVAQLGLCHHLVRALDIWTFGQPNFGKLFYSLPFGSRIIIENISASPRDMKIRIVSLNEIQEQFLTVSTLRNMWNLAPEAFPPCIDLFSLRLHLQVHDTVSFVRIPRIHTNQIFVFKSAVHEIRVTYHEMKVLLSMDPHPNILPMPLFAVTMTDRRGGEDLVCGFISKFFPGGNLASILCEREIPRTLRLEDQIRWAQQLTSTLIFINKSPVKFYSELKTDNLLLTTSNGREDMVFIDFEQCGTWNEFSPPEINCLRTLEWLAENLGSIPEERRAHYLGLAQLFGVDATPEESIYTNPEKGYFKSWIMLSPSESEAAEVYSLGMTLWCIFEGIPCNRTALQKSWPIEYLQEFPEFRHTPEQFRDLIMACTKGYKSWSLDIIPVRRGSKIFPRGRSGILNELTATESETQEATLRAWIQWLEEMERFLWARKRWLGGGSDEADLEILGFPNRPKLQNILDELDDHANSRIFK